LKRLVLTWHSLTTKNMPRNKAWMTTQLRHRDAPLCTIPCMCRKYIREAVQEMMHVTLACICYPRSLLYHVTTACVYSIPVRSLGIPVQSRLCTCAMCVHTTSTLQRGRTSGRSMALLGTCVMTSSHGRERPSSTSLPVVGSSNVGRFGRLLPVNQDLFHPRVSLTRSFA
jgi:hypothetical protein